MSLVKFRDHKGGLAESMETVQEFSTFKELEAYIQGKYCAVGRVKIEPYTFDDRIGWDTHIVLQVTQTSQCVGFTNGMLEKEEEFDYFERMCECGHWIDKHQSFEGLGGYGKCKQFVHNKEYKKKERTYELPNNFINIRWESRRTIEESCLLRMFIKDMWGNPKEVYSTIHPEMADILEKLIERD